MSEHAVAAGLSHDEAGRRLARYGPNSIPEQPTERLWQRWLRQFRNPLIYILIFALVFDLAAWSLEGMLGAPIQSITIGLILAFNGTLGVWQETRSEAALHRLRELSAPRSWVYRDGGLIRVATTELVPGDAVRIEAGERIGADGRLEFARGLMVDESILTGESVPLDKATDDDVFCGTLAVGGKARFVVTATGSNSSMGKLAALLGSVGREPSPLERRLDVFGRRVTWIVVSLATVLLALGLATRGLDDFNMLFLFAVALAVAAVPESLPAVLTLALALGVERMARRKAVVRRLSAVEALGSVTVIATDKTGTLTENQMRVDRLDASDSSETLRAMVLANDADPASGAGDPMEAALLEFASNEGIELDGLRESHPRVSERPFDAEWKFMRVTVETASGITSYLKGAPETLMERCLGSSEQRAQRGALIDRHAAEGYRTLAFAKCEGDGERDLTWLGLALLRDPPRPEVPEAIVGAQRSGIRVVMMTGDHPATARSIAEQVNIRAHNVLTGSQLDELDDTSRAEQIRSTDVFARVTPAHKLAIVTTLQQQDESVAVTGDGVNDAPALKAADVGIAMGMRGSDVSREVADLVLLDDNFATLVAAIEEGRSIYENVQKFIRTLFSTNLSETMLITIGALWAFGVDASGGELLLPLAAVQILWVNLLTDTLPALALATDRNPGAMARTPRPASAPLLDRVSLLFVLIVGILGGLVGLGLYWQLPRSGYAAGSTQTIVFCFLVFVQLSFVLPARRVHWQPLFNIWVPLAISASVAAQFAVLALPALSAALQVVSLRRGDLGVIAVATAGCWLLAEATSAYSRSRGTLAAPEINPR